MSFSSRTGLRWEESCVWRQPTSTRFHFPPQYVTNQTLLLADEDTHPAVWDEELPALPLEPHLTVWEATLERL
jgi:hypothetical protein